ncbi:hypothetical protein BCR44DRAFT_1442491, partial [Catenaria anguillulae PL171]
TSATRRRCPATVSLKDRGEGDCSNVAASDSSQSRSTPQRISRQIDAPLQV